MCGERERVCVCVSRLCYFQESHVMDIKTQKEAEILVAAGGQNLKQWSEWNCHTAAAASATAAAATAAASHSKN